MTPDDASLRLAHDAQWMEMQVGEVYHRLATLINWLGMDGPDVGRVHFKDRVDEIMHHVRPVLAFAEGVAKRWDTLPASTRDGFERDDVSPADPHSPKVRRGGTAQAATTKPSESIALEWLDIEIKRVEEQQRNAVSGLESMEMAVERNAALLSALKRVLERATRENSTSEIPLTETTENGNP